MSSRQAESFGASLPAEQRPEDREPEDREDGQPRPAKRRGYLVPGVIALFVVAVLAVVIDVTTLETHNPPSLAGRDVSVFIAQAIQAEHPTGSPPEVSCPTSEPVRAGTRFTCHLHQGGTLRPIAVREVGSQGQFTWSLGS